ncbi:MAG: hypothetical protein A2252_08855 [Elusimicrobia bacterium RIFOXYA2_FULL_39_19]|nr:MAG: hypothetical protein A2252_08855 [Elusimicrobia bacterium RIFOXYA2_FULL_39_19]
MNSKTNVIELLGKVQLFSGFNTTDLEKVSKISKTKFFPKKKKIFTENTPGDSLYVVAAGCIKIFAQTKNRKKVFAYLGPGEFFGELALINGERKRSASAETTSETELLVIHRKDFQQILQKDPRLSLNLLSVIAKRLRMADQEIELITFQDVFGRIIKIILNLSKKYGKKTSEGIKVDLPLDHTDIAELAGTVREMATRVCIKLKNLNCIDYVSKHIIIKDESKLKEMISE